MLKKIYRLLKWNLINIASFGRSARLIYIDPEAVIVGQKPKSQFQAANTYKFLQDGEWDLDVLPVEEHPLYYSYKLHFIDGVPWADTPFFKLAMREINQGGCFRGEYSDLEELNLRFEKCDSLFNEIRDNGYKSNRKLYQEGKIDNILHLLDEVTINISREGGLILNDGWHRFTTARLLGVNRIPVRVLVKHPSSIDC